MGDPRTHTKRAAAAAIGTHGAAAHLTAYSLVCFPAARCDAGGPLRSPPLPLGEYSHLRGGRRSCGRLFAAPVPALVDADARTAAVTPSLPPSKPAAINAVFPQEAEGDDDFERRRGDDVAPKCRHLDSVSAAACPQRLPRTRRGTRGGRSKTKWLLTQRPLCPPT